MEIIYSSRVISPNNVLMLIVVGRQKDDCTLAVFLRARMLWASSKPVTPGMRTTSSEAIFQEEISNPIGHVDIPVEFNTLADYSAAMVADAPHPVAARAWLDFIVSEGAFKVLEHYSQFVRSVPFRQDPISRKTRERSSA